MTNRTIAGIVGAFLIGVAAIFLLPATLFESANLKRAKAQLGKFLFDPYSAQFDDVREINTAIGEMVCGLVNAKNRMGAYVGRKPFYYVVLNGEMGVISNNSDAFLHRSFAKYCFPDRRFPDRPGDDAGWGSDK
jgi:hypothetical protein